MRKLFVILAIFSSLNAHSFTETIVLAEIAATLSADLAQTLKLLNIAEEQQQKLKKVHDNVQHRTMLANRIQRRITEIQRIGEMEVYDIKSLNRAIREMKYYYGDGKALSNEIAKSFIIDEEKIAENDIKKGDHDKERKEVETMTKSSLLGTYEESSKNTAINSALTNEILLDIRDTTLEIQSSMARRNNEERIQEIKKQDEKQKLKESLGVKADQDYWNSRKGKL